MPRRFSAPGGFQLGVWVSRKRSHHKQDKLDDELAAKLEIIPGWTWNVDADRYRAGLEALREFVGKEGHCRVPYRYVTEHGDRLGNWVMVRRREYGEGRLAPERVADLEEIPGWSWESQGGAPRNRKGVGTTPSPSADPQGQIDHPSGASEVAQLSLFE